MIAVLLSEELLSQTTDGSATAAIVEAPAFEVAAAIDSGETAWILASTALVLFMTIPGLALIFGGS